MKPLEVLTKLEKSTFLFFISFFAVSVTQLTPKSSNDFMILIISSFSCSHNFFSTYFSFKFIIAFEAKLLTYPVKLCLAKGIAKSVITLLPKLPNQEPKDQPD